MPIPDFQSIMRPLLEVLSDGQEHSMVEIHDQICKKFDLTAEEIKTRISSGNQTIIRNRVGWARTYLKKAGCRFAFKTDPGFASKFDPPVRPDYGLG